MKKCPYCAEEIQDEAIVCRYCGRDLVAKPIPVYPATPADSVEIKKVKKKTSVGKIILFVILSMVIVCVVLIVIGNVLNKTTISASPTPAVLIPANYGIIAASELQTYADQHKGEKVKVALDILSFTPGSDNKQLQGYISGTGTEIIVFLNSPASGIYVNDTVTIYGTINGNFSYTSVAGWKMSEPLLIDAFYTKP